ncbi:toll-like receptor 4 [Saccostrea cucullata]|uniref:toll-like receptor 4 n=1 Tax=Saccostrea cuccullata TaxID=36930 RepID=UPI002ED1DA4A
MIEVHAKCLSIYKNNICGTGGVYYDCQNQEFTSVPKVNVSGVVAIDLSYNNITNLTNSDFEGMDALKALYFTRNKLQRIEKNAFQHCSQLCILDLAGNGLTKDSIEEGAFRYLTALEDLRMNDNPFSKGGYPDVEIGRLTSLRNFTLDATYYLSFSTEFQRLKRLRYLQILPSAYFWFDNYSFMNLGNLSIEYLDLQFSDHSACYHDIEDIFWPFSSLKGLTFQTFCGLRYVLKSLKSLKRLKFNQMEYINFTRSSPFNGEPVLLNDYDVAFLKNICVKFLSLQDTNTVGIPTLNPSIFMECIEEIDVSHNSIYTYSTFVMFLQARRIKLVNFSHLNDCRLPSSRGKLLEMREMLPKRPPVNATLSKSLEEIDVSYTYAKPTLLLYVQLKIFATNLKKINFQYIGFPLCSLNNIELHFPSLRSIDVSGSSCDNLNLHFLKHLPSLTEVYMRNTKLNIGLATDVNGTFFRGLSKLTMVDFSENALKELPADLFLSQASSMKCLILESNSFTTIPRALNFIPRLEFLDLRSNKLSYFSKESISIIDNLPNIMIDIRNNPFDCSCNALESLKWIRDNIKKFVYLNRAQCNEMEGPRIPVLKIINNLRALELKCISQLWLDISISIVSSMFLIVLVVAMMYRYRIILRYGVLRIRLFWRRGFANNLTRDSSAFDTYISYSPVDSLFVSLHLYPKLQEENLRISFRDKDFKPGSTFAEEVVEFINISKCVVFVVTQTFLKYDWGTYEIQVAKIHAIHKNARILLIIKDDIEVEDLPRDLLYVWWKIKPIRWPDANNAAKREKFWRKFIKSIKES